MALNDEITIISCGTMREDLERLQEEGLLEGAKLVFTDPCLKERSRELERQLKEELEQDNTESRKVVVIYGNGCFIDTSNPERDIDAVINETGADYRRIKKHSCIEMMLSDEEKEALSEGQKVYWLMPAWIENRDEIYEDWDLGKRNQTFPQNDIALVADSRGYFMKLMEEDPEKILEFSDWMGLPLDSRDIELSRFRRSLLECIEELEAENQESG